MIRFLICLLFAKDNIFPKIEEAVEYGATNTME